MNIVMRSVIPFDAQSSVLCHYLQPSHHIPYLYAQSGAAFKTQERVREIALANYNNTPDGLSGVSVSIHFVEYSYPTSFYNFVLFHKQIEYRTKIVGR